MLKGAGGPPLGSRRGAVEAFLLGALQEGSLALYRAALERFRTSCDEASVDFSGLGAEEQDWILAEFLFRLCEAGEPRGHATVLFAACRKVCPNRAYQTSAK
eukprot:10222972-Lingulodinium_polyedra.AAC.1